MHSCAITGLKAFAPSFCCREARKGLPLLLLHELHSFVAFLTQLVSVSVSYVSKSPHCTRNPLL